MKERKIYLIYIYFFISAITVSCTRNIDTDFRTTDGVLDLSKKIFNGDWKIQTQGRWKIYWEKIIQSPEDEKKLQDDGYFSIPSSWKGFRLKNGKKLPSFGYATFVLKVKFNDDTILKYKNLYVYIPYAQSAFTVYTNNEIIMSRGIVGINELTAKPLKGPAYGHFTPKTELSFYFQISNFIHDRGGPRRSFYIGTENEILNFLRSKERKDFFLIGLALVFVLYHLFSFIFWMREWANLWLGLFSLAIISHALMVGRHFEISYPYAYLAELYMRIEYITYYLLVLFFTNFSYSVFKEWVNKKIINSIRIYIFVIILLIPFLSSYYLSKYITLFHLITYFSILYIFYIQVKITISKKNNLTIYSLTGYLFLAVTFLNDICYLNNYYNTELLAHYGISIFIFTQSILIAKKNTKTQNQLEAVSEELRNQRDNLEIKVKERTEELEALIEMKDNFVAMVNHDLKNILGPILGVSKYLLETGLTDTQTKLVEIISNNSNLILKQANDFLDFALLQKGEMNLKFNLIDIKDLTISVINTFNASAKAKNIEIELSANEDIIVELDETKIYAVISNLVSNAIKFSIGNNKININILKIDSNLEFHVIDYGIGIPEDKLDKVFDPYVKIRNNENSLISGTGLGLTICKKIIELHGGEIRVKSEINKGSDFYFIIPLNK